MIAGMVPTAMAIGEGGEQAAPLGRAVIGGLVASTVATLLFVPAIYSIIARSGVAKSPSLDPDDPQYAHAPPLADGSTT
jgi:Cu/Ag efflux pump CusA